MGCTCHRRTAAGRETVTYAYDSLNRLLTASGSGWGEQYGFDGFGNLLSKTVTAGSGPSLSITVHPATNRIQGVSGLSYDANGNQNVGTYDSENRLIDAGGNQYYYDAQNRRVWIWAGATDSLGNTTSYTVNMYAPGGQKLGAYLFVPGTTTQNGLNVAMINVTATSSDEYFGSRRLAVIDQLGSAGNNGTSLGTYYPWGEVKGSTNPQNTWSFATYWQDSASGLDYSNNRYYSNAYGRFTSPDPSRSSGGPGDTNNPQSWNHYTYVTGDPVNWTRIAWTFHAGRNGAAREPYHAIFWFLRRLTGRDHSALETSNICGVAWLRLFSYRAYHPRRVWTLGCLGRQRTVLTKSPASARLRLHGVFKISLACHRRLKSTLSLWVDAWDAATIARVAAALAYVG